MIPIKDREYISEYGELVKTFYVYFEDYNDEGQILFEVWKVGDSYQCIPNPIPKLYGHLNTRGTIQDAEDYAISSYRLWLIQKKKD